MEDGLKKIVFFIIFWGLLIAGILVTVDFKNLAPNKNSNNLKTFNDAAFISRNGIVSSAQISSKSRPDIYDAVRDPFNHSVFYLATSEGLFRSVNNAVTFSQITLPKEINNSVIARVFADSAQPGHFSFLLFNRDHSIIYETFNNFASVQKGFELTAGMIKNLSGNSKISSLVPAGQTVIIGTSDR